MCDAIICRRRPITGVYVNIHANRSDILPTATVSKLRFSASLTTNLPMYLNMTTRADVGVMDRKEFFNAISCVHLIANQ